MEQVHTSGHRLCNKMGGGLNIMDKYQSNDNKKNYIVHFCQVWMSTNYSHKQGCAFYLWCDKTCDKSFLFKTLLTKLISVN